MSTLRLFDLLERKDEDPAQYGETKFSYLNRSARLDVMRVREVLEDWFSDYPDAEKPDLRGRFRSADDNNHLGAFFELFLHELLLRLRCQVYLHPTAAAKKGKHPDYLVTPLSGSGFYMEAAVSTDESRDEAAADARMNAVYDALNLMDSPNFFVGMELRGAPSTPPPASKMRSFLEKQLASLDPDDIARLIDSSGLEAAPHWPWEHEGWKIVFFLYQSPRMPEIDLVFVPLECGIQVFAS